MLGPFLSEVSAMLIADLFLSVDVVVVVEEVVHLLTDVICTQGKQKPYL